MAVMTMSRHNPAVRHILKLAGSSIFVAVLMGGIGWSQASQKATVVLHVGIAEYQAPEETYRKYLQFFRELAKLAPDNKPVTFQVAVGSYSEVLDWLNKKEIELAVMAATPMAETLRLADNRISHAIVGPDLSSADDLKQRIVDAYVGTIGEIDSTKAPTIGSLVGSDDPLASQIDTDYNARFRYRTFAVVAKNTFTENIKSFKELLNPRPPFPPPKFLFVRPYSVSGYIIPRAFLQAQGIDLAKSSYAYDFTGQHNFSIDRLLKPSPEDKGKTLVAFVDDDAHPTEHDVAQPIQGDKLKGLKILSDTEGLNGQRQLIPIDILLVNYNLGNDDYNRFRSLMCDLRDRSKHHTSELALKHEDGWQQNFVPIEDNLNGAKNDLPAELPYRVTLDQIIDGITQYGVVSKKSARVALVLSGGGA